MGGAQAPREGSASPVEVGHSPTQPTDEDAQRRSEPPVPSLVSPADAHDQPASSSRTSVVTASGTDIPARRATASGDDPAGQGVPHPSLVVVEVRRRRRRRVRSTPRSSRRSSAPRIIVAPSRIISSGVSARRAGHRARYGEDLTSELEGVIDGDPRAALRLAFHHHQRSRQRDDDPVPRGEVLRPRRNGGRVFAHERAGSGDRTEEFPAARRVGDIDPRAQHRDRSTRRLERALVRRSVDPLRGAGDDGQPGGDERAPEVLRDSPVRGPSTSSIRRSRHARASRRAAARGGRGTPADPGGRAAGRRTRDPPA